MANNIIKGTLWSAVQRFGSLAIGFISNMVLARLLCPEDFGVMGMVMVFIGLADVLVDGGLGNALIQKKNITNRDLTTVFTSNFFFSIFFFAIFFIAAPYVESYIDINNLSLYVRILSFQILFRAMYVIPFSLMVKDMDFYKLAVINLFASFSSVALSIIMALLGCGVWSLIAKSLSLDGILVLLYYIYGNPHLKVGFSSESFKELFGFGFFVALSNLIETGYTNTISFLIGKKYSVKELGYYNQAYALQQIPTYSITAVLNQVLFPYFSNIQDNEAELKNKSRMSIQIITFFVFPILLFLISFADQVIVILYSDKWLPCVPYFQILCISGLVNALIHINRSMLKSKGYSKQIFNIQLSSAAIGITLLVIGLQYSLVAALSALALNSILLFILTAFYSSKICKYNLFSQIKDVSPCFIISVVCSFSMVYVFNWINCHVFIKIGIELISFAILYILLNKLCNTKAWADVLMIMKSIRNK